METTRHTVIIEELFQDRVGVGGQGFRQNTIGSADVALIININVMPTGDEGAVCRIFPALHVQIAQYGATIGSGIAVFAIAHSMPHRAAHVIHYAGRHRFDACIHRRVVQGHTAPATNAEQTDTVAIHLFLQAQKVHRGTEILGIDIR